ncbi:MAG: hypothetical protein R6X25_07010 [Candidatus Krumholzibacteriia bacterium]
MVQRWFLCAAAGAVLVLLGAGHPAAAAESGATAGDEQWLRSQLEALDPPQRLRDLARWGAWRAERGGGFLGLVPDLPDDPDSIPVPEGPAGVDAAVSFLTAARAANLAAIAKASPDYPLQHGGRPLPDWTGTPPPGWRLELDVTVPIAFLDALEAGGVTDAEARAIAALPANREMLDHRDQLAYLPDPHPTAADLAALMACAGADDPLSRIWCWLNPWNGFGYADLVMNATAYREQLAQLSGRGHVLTGEALARSAALMPAGVTFTDRFALTVGWGIRGWATTRLGGLNIEHVKDDWDLLLGTLTEETFHRLQLQVVPTWDGSTAQTYEELAVADTGDPALDKFHELLLYTVLEGTANLARGDLVPSRVRSSAQAGAALVDSFVNVVVDGGDVDAADELIAAGLRNNGPLYGLGWSLASQLAAAEGPQAVGRYLRRGPVAFVEAAARYDHGRFLKPRVLESVQELRAAAGR